MKLTCENADHRTAAIQALRFFIIDEAGVRTTLFLHVFGYGDSPPMMMPPHQKWGIEVEYEAVDEGGAR